MIAAQSFSITVWFKVFVFITFLFIRPVFISKCKTWKKNCIREEHDDNDNNDSCNSSRFLLFSKTMMLMKPNQPSSFLLNVIFSCSSYSRHVTLSLSFRLFSMHLFPTLCYCVCDSLSYSYFYNTFVALRIYTRMHGPRPNRYYYCLCYYFAVRVHVLFIFRHLEKIFLSELCKRIEIALEVSLRPIYLGKKNLLFALSFAFSVILYLS